MCLFCPLQAVRRGFGCSVSETAATFPRGRLSTRLAVDAVRVSHACRWGRVLKVRRGRLEAGCVATSDVCLVSELQATGSPPGRRCHFSCCARPIHLPASVCDRKSIGRVVCKKIAAFSYHSLRDRVSQALHTSSRRHVCSAPARQQRSLGRILDWKRGQQKKKRVGRRQHNVGVAVALAAAEQRAISKIAVCRRRGRRREAYTFQRRAKARGTCGGVEIPRSEKASAIAASAEYPRRGRGVAVSRLH